MCVPESIQVRSPSSPAALHVPTHTDRHGAGFPNSSGGARPGQHIDPYGVDPVFSPRSKLYDARLAAQDGAAQLYYNTRPAAGEVAATGTPYGFFARAGLKVGLVYAQRP